MPEAQRDLESLLKLADVTDTRALGSQDRTAPIESRVLRFLELAHLAGQATQSDDSATVVHSLAKPPPTPERPAYDVSYAAIHRLNDDILLHIFNCYRLDDVFGWNDRLGWRKLSHVCQRWRYIMHESPFHLGMHIECTYGTPIVDMLAHLPPLPLLIHYKYLSADTMTEQDEMGIYYALQFHDRVRQINLHLSPAILKKCLAHMDACFPTLENLSLSFSGDEITIFTLPEAFLAPNLRHLDLPRIALPKRLRLLTSTVSLVTLSLGCVQFSGYFCPRLLVARLWSLSQLEELTIEFCVPIPRTSSENEMLDEQGSPKTLPNLRTLTFQGFGEYLEHLVAQIRVPLLERLDITLSNQLTFTLPHLYHLINITEGFKLPSAKVCFGLLDVYIVMARRRLFLSEGDFLLRVKCNRLDRQIDCAAQICRALIPTLSGVERITLDLYYYWMPDTEGRFSGIDSTMWRELLRLFIGAKELFISEPLEEELARALQVDEVGAEPGFLPNLKHIGAADNLFASFIDTRRAVNRPVQFSRWSLLAYS